jgi:hypothetical protein
VRTLRDESERPPLGNEHHLSFQSKALAIQRRPRVKLAALGVPKANWEALNWRLAIQLALVSRDGRCNSVPDSITH